MTFELSSLPAAAGNRLASATPGTRESLASHAGKRFTVVVGAMVSHFRIGAQGTLESISPAEEAADLRLAISPLDVPTLMAEPARFRELVHEEGDAALARDLEFLASTLPWFVERQLASAFGPIVGERMAAAGRSLLAFPREAIGRVAGNVLRYAHDEARLFASGADMRPFAEEITALAARTAALEARISALETPAAAK